MKSITSISHLRWLFSPPLVPPAAKGGIKKWRRRRRTSPVGTVSQPIGKPFNGQAKGLLWLTWRSYAGPSQYYIPPEGGALNPSGRRQPVPDRTLGAQGQRPGGAINPRGEAASTYGNTGKHRPGPSPDPDRAERRLNPQAPQGACPYEVSVTGLSFCHRGIGERMAVSGQPIARDASLPPATSTVPHHSFLKFQAIRAPARRKARAVDQKTEE